MLRCQKIDLAILTRFGHLKKEESIGLRKAHK